VEERKQLKELLDSGINVMLISPRRWGKSSLVKVAMDELMQENKRVRVCFIDAFSIKTEAEFYRTFAKEVISCTASTLEKRLDDVKNFLKGISPSITLKSDATDSLSFDLKFDLQDNDVMEILELPEKLASAKDIQLIVCIDEFQQLALLPGYKAMEGKMRSVWQKQAHTSYCFYGSKRHMMMDIFNNSANPFYRFGQVLFLDKIKKEEWVPFITGAFRRTGKSITDAQAERICDIVKCHSWYLQQLCYFIWSGTSGAVNDEVIDRRVRQLIDTNMPMFMNDVENLTATQIAMLRAVADGEFQFNAMAIVKKYELGSAQTITRNKKILVERDFVEKDNKHYHFADPVFELWFRREYM
jgi:AAA+ ATPase superfamily predicted ATPase